MGNEDQGFTAGQPAHPTGRGRWPIVAVAVVVALVAGGVAFVLLPGEGGTILRLRFTPHRTTSYRVTSRDHGSSEAAGSRYDTRTDATLDLAVDSVDAAGTATATAMVHDVRVSPSDLEPSNLRSLGDQPVRIAADGRQLDCILVVADEQGQFFSLMDPFLPFLSPDEVSPGDTWTVEARQDLGVGSGGTRFTGTATLERIDDGGVAVVEADLTETWDLTADAAQVSRVGGGTIEHTTNTVAWDGTEQLHLTSRVDTARGVVLSTTVSGDYDLKITSAGGDGNDATLHNTGTFTQAARLVTS